ncbi:hypothetical protein BDQ17DRAFT_1180704, partial [Cyathus striatus]
MQFLVFALASGVLPIVTVSATTISVGVGNSTGGLVFEPTNVTAAVGDVIGFLFTTGNHSVVQSTFADPCTPKKLGTSVNSGYFNNSPEVTQWNMKVVDISAPMWFYCQQTIPVNHCQAGMVFAVNPTSDQIFVAFQQAAMASGSSGSATDSSGSSSTTFISNIATTTGSTLIS